MKELACLKANTIIETIENPQKEGERYEFLLWG